MNCPNAPGTNYSGPDRHVLVNPGNSSLAYRLPSVHTDSAPTPLSNNGSQSLKFRHNLLPGLTVQSGMEDPFQPISFEDSRRFMEEVIGEETCMSYLSDEAQTLSEASVPVDEYLYEDNSNIVTANLNNPMTSEQLTLDSGPDPIISEDLVLSTDHLDPFMTVADGGFSFLDLESSSAQKEVDGYSNEVIHASVQPTSHAVVVDHSIYPYGPIGTAAATAVVTPSPSMLDVDPSALRFRQDQYSLYTASTVVNSYHHEPQQFHDSLHGYHPTQTQVASSTEYYPDYREPSDPIVQLPDPLPDDQLCVENAMAHEAYSTSFYHVVPVDGSTYGYQEPPTVTFDCQSEVQPSLQPCAEMNQSDQAPGSVYYYTTVPDIDTNQMDARLYPADNSVMHHTEPFANAPTDVNYWTAGDEMVAPQLLSHHTGYASEPQSGYPWSNTAIENMTEQLGPTETQMSQQHHNHHQQQQLLSFQYCPGDTIAVNYQPVMHCTDPHLYPSVEHPSGLIPPEVANNAANNQHITTATTAFGNEENYTGMLTQPSSPTSSTSYDAPNEDIRVDLSCPHCDSRFLRLDDRDVHLRLHTSEQPFECVLCGQRFNQASNLNRHLSSHKTWPPVETEESGNEYVGSHATALWTAPNQPSSRQDRVTSMNHKSSRKSRSWTCRFCHLTLSSYMQLRQHMIQHKANRIFVCVFDACLATFNRPEALLSHLIESHPSSCHPNNTCQACGLTFTDAQRFVQHWLPRHRGLSLRCGGAVRCEQPPPEPSTIGRIPKISILRHGGSIAGRSFSKRGTRARLLTSGRSRKTLSSRVYRCPFCPRRRHTLTRLRKHLESHGDLLTSQPPPPTPTIAQTPNTPFVTHKRAVKTTDRSEKNSKPLLFLFQLPGDESVSVEKVGNSHRTDGRSKSRRNATGSSSSPSNLVCQYCGKQFQKVTFFTDHEKMCKQAPIREATRSLLSCRASPALTFDVLSECGTTRARRCQLWFPHCPAGPVETPVFMPVGTQGAMKGVTVGQLEALDCRILLGNTYHLGHRPGPVVMRLAGGLHKFMSWPRAILTDSGGFQMVSLSDLSVVEEDGVHFTSPHNATQMLLTPEESVGHLQATLGADVVMQLDHVVHVLTEENTMKVAMDRSIRWLDRGIQAHESQKTKQNLFAITQGGLDTSMREHCIEEMVKRKEQVAGFAIGGLSGGEAKSDFWQTVRLSTGKLPRDRPRYLMGVGFPVDLVVCVALGCDMFDCVYPTRTGRFGHALTPWGQLNLRQARYKSDFRPIQSDCPCPHCTRPLSRAFIHASLSGRQVVASAAISLHNLAYMLSLMRQMREAISAGTLPQFVRHFFEQRCYSTAVDNQRVEYEGTRPAQWTVDALASVGIDISDIGSEGVVDEPSDDQGGEMKEAVKRAKVA